MILKRVGVLSCGKVLGAIYGAFGLIAGAFFALFSILGAGFAAMQTSEPSAMLGAIFGVGALFILPIFYGVMGFIGGIISAFFYNVIAGVVGGVELDLE